jgi:serine/threonine protein kinase
VALRTDLVEQLQTALVGNYSIERELGHGAMATVYLAHDRAGNPVALKLLNPDLGSTVGAERFRREIRVAARLQHPNILGVLDSGVTTVSAAAGGASVELLWFTMPFVPGQNLWERFEKEGPFPADQVVRIGCAVASALAYAHGQGVVHRDIKPDNIMLEDQRVLVADFGLARAVSEAHEKLTTTGTVVGTPTYMSPEQASGDKEIDGRSDIFALACVLYELLSGMPPFSGPTPQAALARRFAGPPRKLRPVVQVPEHMEVAIFRALARHPAERFASADDFAAALSGTPVSVRASVPPPKAPPNKG